MKFISLLILLFFFSGCEDQKDSFRSRSPTESAKPDEEEDKDSLDQKGQKGSSERDEDDEEDRKDAEEGSLDQEVSLSCDENTLNPSTETLSLTVDGQNREYILHIPKSYQGDTKVPLVLDFHGLTSNAGSQMSVSGWREKADAEGFIVAFPNGLSNSWNGGDYCCGRSRSGNVDDVGFARAVVKDIQAKGCVDQRKIYATGLSNGGSMSHRLACDAADVFVAVAPVSQSFAYENESSCKPDRPITVVDFRATNDNLVPYNGGLFPGAKASINSWLAVQSCDGSPESTHSGVCETYSGCKGGGESSGLYFGCGACAL